MPESAAAHDATAPPSPRRDEGGDPDSFFPQITPEDLEAIRNFVYETGQDDDDGSDELMGIISFEGPPRSYIVHHEMFGIRATARYELVVLVPPVEEAPHAVPYGSLKKAVIEADQEEDACAVCLEDMEVGSEACSLACKHKYHEACIVQWLEKKLSCPLCRCKV